MPVSDKIIFIIIQTGLTHIFAHSLEIASGFSELDKVNYMSQVYSTRSVSELPNDS